MLRSISFSTPARLSLALAGLLALIASGVLMATRGAGPRGAAPTALAQSVELPGSPAAGTPGIAVIGEGEASGAPDVAYVNLGVQSSGASAREALDAASAAMAAVIDAIKRLGVPDRNLQTGGVSLTPILSQPKPGDQTPPQIVSYRATNSLNVTVEQLGQTGAIIDAAVGAGANLAGGVRFAIKDDSALRRQALQQAAQAARAKADALAGALGLHITGVQSLSEQSSVQPLPRQALAADAALAASVPIQPGELTVRVQVRAVFSFS